MKSTIFLIGLICITTNASAGYSWVKQPDGSYIYKGCHNQIIGDTNYICCDNECQTREAWIKRLESAVDTNYMADLAEQETVDRYTLSDEKVEIEDADDKTPALGKAQKKLDNLGNKLIGVFF